MTQDDTTEPDELEAARLHWADITAPHECELRRAILAGKHDGSQAIRALLAAIRSERAKDDKAQAEYGWLIELGSSEPCNPRYWGGVHGWTRDHLKAVRFVREVDAQSIAESMSDGVPDEYRLCEHAWETALAAIKDSNHGS